MSGTEVVEVPVGISVRHNQREDHAGDERNGALLDLLHNLEDDGEWIFGVDVELCFVTLKLLLGTLLNENFSRKVKLCQS